MILTPDVWHNLPTELIREVILHVASHSSQMARNLRLVSRYTNVWVLPFLFHALIFSSSTQVSQFVSTVLPAKRLSFSPSQSNTGVVSRSLSTYNIDSLALAVPVQLPSVETALAKVAPAFSRVTKLALTARNLTSHAHWLRLHPIHPRRVMIFHFGRPYPVNFKERIFTQVTHLQTSVLVGHRKSSVGDLPALTHLAVYSRPRLASAAIGEIAGALQAILSTLPNLQSLVLSLGDVADLTIVSETDIIPWELHLRRCLRDKRFAIVPYARLPRLEWDDVVSGRKDVWERAEDWASILTQDVPERARTISEVFVEMVQETRRLPGLKKSIELEWEMSLVQRANFSEVDPTESVQRRTVFPSMD